MNELQVYSREADEARNGFHTILVSEPSHPYIGHWWPPGHMIGYEHEFIHAVADFLSAVDSGEEIKPDFEDGVRILKVLEAGLESARSGRKVTVSA